MCLYYLMGNSCQQLPVVSVLLMLSVWFWNLFLSHSSVILLQYLQQSPYIYNNSTRQKCKNLTKAKFLSRNWYQLSLWNFSPFVCPHCFLSGYLGSEEIVEWIWRIKLLMTAMFSKHTRTQNSFFLLSFFLSFLPSSLIWLLLPSHCKYRGLKLYLITPRDTHKHTQ
jgi:hypothetical protein